MAVVVTLAGVDVTDRVAGFTTTRVVNGVGTCRLRLDDTAGTLRPAVFDTLSIAVDGTTRWAGTVKHVAMTVLVDGPTPGRQATVTATDFNALTQRALLNGILSAGQTLKQTLQSLVTNHLTTFGVTLDAGQVDGPTLEEQGYPWQTIEQVLNYLSRVTGYLWTIDANKVLSMWAVGTRSAPATFSEANANIDQVSWDEENADYRNATWVIYGPSEVIEKTDRFEGDGATRTFTPRYFWAERPGQVYDVQAAEYRNVGVKGVDTLFEWVWDESNLRLEQLTEAPPGTPHAALTAGEYLDVTYQAQFPSAVYVEDAAAVAARGLFMRAETIESVTDYDAAVAYGTARNRQYVETPQRLRLRTRTLGNDPGEVCTVTVSELDLSGSHFIEQETLVYAPLPEAAGEAWVTGALELVSGVERQESWLEWWRDRLGTSVGVSGAASSGAGAVTVTSAGRVMVDLGGSRIGVVSGATLSQPLPEYRTVYLDPAWFVGGLATIRAELQVLQAGTTVTPRLLDADSLALVGEGSATGSTTWERQVFSVVIPAPAHYVLYLERNNDDASARGVAYVE